MAARDVPDLMPQNRRQLRLAIGQRQQAAGDINIPARQRKSIGDRRIYNEKLVLHIGALGILRHLLPDLVDIGIQRRVIVKAKLLDDIFMLFRADIDFLLRRHQGGELLLSRRRIGAAPRQDRNKYDCK